MPGPVEDRRRRVAAPEPFAQIRKRRHEDEAESLVALAKRRRRAGEAVE
jgi:hypothetical protein